jgi:transcriptional regulator with XRE-family HTH domain
MTYPAPTLRELGDFLKARRGELQPDQVGLHLRGNERRRVRGLRREEVAELLSISTDYYTRIEQGRLAPSGAVLPALVQAMRLDEEQADYVRTLVNQADAHREGSRTGSRRRQGGQAVHPRLQRLLDQLDRVPALVFGRHLDILAWNALAAELLLDFSQVPAHLRNYVRLVFTDPVMRDRYPEWEQVARTCVAVLRMNAANNPNDPALSALIGDLSIATPDFSKWWAERRVAHQNFGTKTIRHPVVGDLTLDWDSFYQVGDPEQQLIIWSAEADSPSATRLAELSALTKSAESHR